MPRGEALTRLGPHASTFEPYSAAGSAATGSAAGFSAGFAAGGASPSLSHATEK